MKGRVIPAKYRLSIMCYPQNAVLAGLPECEAQLWSEAFSKARSLDALAGYCFADFSPYVSAQELPPYYEVLIQHNGLEGGSLTRIREQLGLTVAELETLYILEPDFAACVDESIADSHYYWLEYGRKLVSGEGRHLGYTARDFLRQMRSQFTWPKCSPHGTALPRLRTVAAAVAFIEIVRRQLIKRTEDRRWLENELRGS